MSHEYQAERHDLGGIEVVVARDAGPRVLGYRRHHGPQLFASLPGEVIEHGGNVFSFIGGHRLWRAPEVPRITYRPDNQAVAVDAIEGGVRLTGSPDAEGITKTITLRQRGAMTVVDHTVLNAGSAPVVCAAWAITQLIPGGFAVLPQPTEPADADGVLPNRSLVLWPYTDPGAPEIELQSSAVLVHASQAPTRSKVGQANRRGWVAYVLGNELFVKWSPLHDDGRDYADLGASVECYRDRRFIELESLGPLAEVPPGGALHHREVWALLDVEALPIESVLASLPEQPAEMID